MVHEPLTEVLEAPETAEAFYAEVIGLMTESQIPFLLSGTYALSCYTGIARPTKDVDVFAKAGDALRMLSFFKERGFDVQVVDERWLSRITRGELFVANVSTVHLVVLAALIVVALGLGMAALLGSDDPIAGPMCVVHGGAVRAGS